MVVAVQLDSASLKLQRVVKRGVCRRLSGRWTGRSLGQSIPLSVLSKRSLFLCIPFTPVRLMGLLMIFPIVSDAKGAVGTAKGAAGMERTNCHKTFLSVLSFLPLYPERLAISRVTKSG